AEIAQVAYRRPRLRRDRRMASARRQGCRASLVAARFGWGWPDHRSARGGWLSAADFARRHALLFPVYVSDTFGAAGYGFARNNRVCVRSRWRALVARTDIGSGSSY